uniref:Uncharacterized protein n=1 Tax=Anopheles atroparvus TaxID=41427 RepID=A0AAG5DK35_ANOAO
AINLLCSLSIDVLSFANCLIDGSFLDLLVETETRRNILSIFMDDCVVMAERGESYSVRTIAELRAKCPHLQIAAKTI